jgi:hypothetical protein
MPEIGRNLSPSNSKDWLSEASVWNSPPSALIENSRQSLFFSGFCGFSLRHRPQPQDYIWIRASPSLDVRLMVFKLIMAASKTWRRLMGENQLPKVIAGVRFKDGSEIIPMPTNSAA